MARWSELAKKPHSVVSVAALGHEEMWFFYLSFV